MVIQGRGWEVGEMGEVVRGYKLPVMSPGGLMYIMVTIVTNTVLCI